MLLLILFQENMNMKGPFSPYPSLYQISSKLFAKNGYKILKFQHMIQQLQDNSPVSLGYSWHNDEILYKGLFVFK
jgi:hypothetical protein